MKTYRYLAIMKMSKWKPGDPEPSKAERSEFHKLRRAADPIACQAVDAILATAKQTGFHPLDLLDAVRNNLDSTSWSWERHK